MALAPEIQALDLEPISFIAAVEYDWSLEKTDEVELEYRAFLQAIHDYPNQPIAPSRDCDRYWHMHLLDTRRYWSDCMQIFGRFIHHFPYSGLRGAQDLKQHRLRFARSQRIIRQLMTELRESANSNPLENHHEASENQRRPPQSRQPDRVYRRA